MARAHRDLDRGGDERLLRVGTGADVADMDCQRGFGQAGRGAGSVAFRSGAVMPAFGVGPDFPITGSSSLMPRIGGPMTLSAMAVLTAVAAPPGPVTFAAAKAACRILAARAGRAVPMGAVSARAMPPVVEPVAVIRPVATPLAAGAIRTASTHLVAEMS